MKKINLNTWKVVKLLIVVFLCFLSINYCFAKNEPFLIQKPNRYTLNDLTNNTNQIKDNYILFDCLYDSSVESIDAYSLFLHMKEKGLNVYYVSLKDNQVYKELESKNKLDKIIGIEKNIRQYPKEFINSISHILPKTKAVITSFEIGTNLDYFFNNIPSLEYIFIQHGQIYLKESFLAEGYLNSNLFDKILISSSYEAEILKKYGWKENQFIKSGLPRYDLLKNTLKSDEKSIFIMFTWRKTNPNIFTRSQYFNKINSLISNDEFINFLKSNNIKVYFTAHHALNEVGNINLRAHSSYIKNIKATEISKYIKKSSLLLTDISSIAFDFIFQNKPVILYGLDRGDKLLEKNQYNDLELLKEKKKTFPNIFFDEKDVIEKIKYYVKNNFTVEKEFLDIYNSFFFIKDNIRENLSVQIENIINNKK